MKNAQLRNCFIRHLRVLVRQFGVTPAARASVRYVDVFLAGQWVHSFEPWRRPLRMPMLAGGNYKFCRQLIDALRRLLARLGRFHHARSAASALRQQLVGLRRGLVR